MEELGHVLSVFEREKIEVTGVQEILSSTDKEVYAKLDKDILHITGENLKINKLIPENKTLSVSGKICGVCYNLKFSKKSLFGKVFK